MGYPLQTNIKQIEAVLEVFQIETGRWPESWEELESHFKSSIWESSKVRQTFTRSFVLLPGVHGHMGPKVRLEPDATLMMVMTGPTERLSDGSGKAEMGRWVLWRTTGGSIIPLWHPEAEITAFSSWPEVQKYIDRHIQAIRGSDKPSTSHPPLITGQKPLNDPNPTTTDDPSSGWKGTVMSRSLLVFLLVAAIGVLWLWTKGRKAWD